MLKLIDLYMANNTMIKIEFPEGDTEIAEAQEAAGIMVITRSIGPTRISPVFIRRKTND